MVGHPPSRLAGFLCLAMLLATAGPARAASLDGKFGCYRVRVVHHALPSVVHGGGPLTDQNSDALLWTIHRNRMAAAGHFILAEVGCATDCIRLVSIDLMTGNVRWLPQTISSWPIKMLQPVFYRRNSRLVTVFGQLNEQGTTGPFHFLLDPDGFHRIRDNQICR